MAMGIRERVELQEFMAEVKNRLTALEAKNGVEHNGEPKDIGARLGRLEDQFKQLNGSVSFIKGQLKEALKG